MARRDHYRLIEHLYIELVRKHDDPRPQVLTNLVRKARRPSGRVHDELGRVHDELGRAHDDLGARP